LIPTDEERFYSSQVGQTLGEDQESYFWKILYECQECRKWMSNKKLDPFDVGRALVKALDKRALEHDELVKKLSAVRKKKYQPGAKSLLISFGEVPGQALHIDMVYPLVQASLNMTNTRPTEVYPVQDQLSVLNWEETGMPVDLFINLLQNRVRKRLSVADKSVLIEIIRENKDIVDSISQYGWLIVSQPEKMAARSKLEESMEEVVGMEWEAVSQSGYFSFAGSIIHAAPPVYAKGRERGKLRMVLFGSFHAEGDDPYDKKSQETAPSWFTGFLVYVFSHIKVNQSLKLFLTSILTVLVGEDPEGAAMTMYNAGPYAPLMVPDLPKLKRDGTYERKNISGKRQQILNPKIKFGHLVSYLSGTQVIEAVRTAGKSQGIESYRANSLKDATELEGPEGVNFKYDPTNSVQQYWPWDHEIDEEDEEDMEE
jgi:hypothetical protein